MQKWLLFFKPIRIAPSISKDEPLNPPIVAYLVLTIATGLWAIMQLNEDAIQKTGALIYQLNLVAIIFIEPFSPLIGAVCIHFAAKKMMSLEGSLRRLILLMYYAGLGSAACRALLVFSTQPAQETGGPSPQTIEGLSTPFPLFVVLITFALGLYSIFVTLRLTMDNYSVGLKAALKLMIYSTLLLSAVAIIFVVVFIAGGGSGTG
jgi:succinate dehydrogenase hydrophobic anchor subunit